MKLNDIATYFGRGVVLLSFIFLGYLLSKLDFSKVVTLFDSSWIWKIALLSTIFCLSYLLNGYAWSRLLAMLSQNSPSLKAVKAYLKSVVFKYLPGNVFHFLGRHALVDPTHTTHKNILLANTLEVLVLLFSSLLLLFIGTFFVDFGFDFYGFRVTNRELVLLFLAMILSVGAIFYFGRERFGFSKTFKLEIFLVVVLMHLLFLLISASLFVLVFDLFLGFDIDSTKGAKMLFIALIAWLFGFILPGAPGGIGVRESIYLLLLPPMVGIDTDMVLVGALIYRVITISGEALTYFLSRVVR